MRNRETIIERTVFLVNLFAKMCMPPFYSLARLEAYCQFRIRKNPNAYLPRWFLAGLYKNYNKNEEAKREYMNMKDLDYLTFQDRIDFAEVLCRLRDYEEVIDILLPVLDRCLRRKDCCRYLGIAYLAKRDFQKAVSYLEKVIESGTRRYEDYWNLGYCYDGIGELDKAKAIYTKGLSIKPNSKELKENLALVYIRFGQRVLDSDLTQAEEHFKRALEINPGDPQALRLMEDIHRIKDDITLVDSLRGRT